MRTLTAAQSAILTQDFHESYWFITAYFADAGVVASYAGIAGLMDGQQFNGGLITTSGFRSSLGSSVDRIDVTVENTDWRWTRISQTVVTLPVRCYVGRLLRTTGGTDWVRLTLLSGIVVSIQSSDGQAVLQCISDLYAAPDVGALRQVVRSCQWKYKDPRTCGAVSSLPTCNKVFESADGCAGRENQHKYGGFLYDTSKDTLEVPPPDPGGNPDPGGGGIGGDEAFRKGVPQHDIPY